MAVPRSQQVSQAVFEQEENLKKVRVVSRSSGVEKKISAFTQRLMDSNKLGGSPAKLFFIDFVFFARLNNPPFATKRSRTSVKAVHSHYFFVVDEAKTFLFFKLLSDAEKQRPLHTGLPRR